MNTKKKVFLGNLHVAYVNASLLSKFCQTFGISNYSAWVREQAFETYNIELRNKEDLAQLQKCVESDYYDSIGEWLQDIMRKVLYH